MCLNTCQSGDMEPFVTTLVVILAQVLPIFCENRKVFEQITSLRNLDTSDVPIDNQPASSTGKCGQLCLEQSCSYFRFLEGTCSMYGTKPTESGTAQGAVYFGINTCPESRGFTSVRHPRMCFKDSWGGAKWEPWNNSIGYCELEGARLMVLSDNRAFDVMLRSRYSAVWVGLKKTNGEWKWLDGSSNVRMWGAGAPSNSSKDCGLFINKGGRRGINDYPCDVGYIFMCEVPMFE